MSDHRYTFNESSKHDNPANADDHNASSHGTPTGDLLIAHLQHAAYSRVPRRTDAELRAAARRTREWAERNTEPKVRPATEIHRHRAPRRGPALRRAYMMVGLFLAGFAAMAGVAWTVPASSSVLRTGLFLAIGAVVFSLLLTLCARLFQRLPKRSEQREAPERNAATIALAGAVASLVATMFVLLLQVAKSTDAHEARDGAIAVQAGSNMPLLPPELALQTVPPSSAPSSETKLGDADPTDEFSEPPPTTRIQPIEPLPNGDAGTLGAGKAPKLVGRASATGSSSSYYESQLQQELDLATTERALSTALKEPPTPSMVRLVADIADAKQVRVNDLRPVDSSRIRTTLSYEGREALKGVCRQSVVLINRADASVITASTPTSREVPAISNSKLDC